MKAQRRIAKLRKTFNDARRRGKHDAARDALLELGELEPDEPRWPHQLGEVHRRKGDTAGAADAFERATDLYAQAGFLARAVAMAKTLLQLDPSRTNVLERVDPTAAQQLHRRARPSSAERAVSLVMKAPALEPAPDAAEV